MVAAAEGARTTLAPHTLSVRRRAHILASPSRREGHDAHTLRQLACAWRGAAAARSRARMRPTSTGMHTALRPFRSRAAATTAGVAALASAAFLGCCAGALHTKSTMGKPVHVSCWAGINARGTGVLNFFVAKVAAGTKEGRWAGAPEWKDHFFGTLDQLRAKKMSAAARNWSSKLTLVMSPRPGPAPELRESNT